MSIGIVGCIIDYVLITSDNMGFEEGNKLGEGRPPGSPNKTTQEIKELYTEIMSGEVDHIPKALEEIRKEDPYKYLMVLDKISNKVIANKKDITSDDKPIQTLPITGVNIIKDGVNEQTSTEAD